MWTLTYSGTTIYVQNPVLGDVTEYNVGQVLSKAASGKIYVYNKAPAVTRELEAQWNEMRAVEFDDLSAFFYTTVNGMVTTFTLTDHYGNAWTARFLEPTLRASIVADQRDSTGTMTVDSVAYPTTKRKKPVYEVQIRLRLEAVVTP